MRLIAQNAQQDPTYLIILVMLIVLLTNSELSISIMGR